MTTAQRCRRECRWLRRCSNPWLLRAYVALCDRLPDGLWVRVARRVAVKRLEEVS